MSSKPRFSRKSLAGFIILVLVIGAGAGLLWGLGASARVHQPPEPVIRPVKVMHLSAASSQQVRSFPGLVSASRETKLAFRVGGPLVALDARIGHYFKKGEVIARIDPRDFKVNLARLSAALGEARANLKAMQTGARAEDIARLEAQIAAARAQLTNAEKDFARQENLLAERAVAQARYDGAKAAYDMARANVTALLQELKKARSGARSEEIEAAEAGIRRLRADIRAAENALADTELTAPFSGVISRRHVENFENIRAGAPVVSFLDLETIEVKSAVTEELIINRSHVTGIQCVLDAYPGRRLEATVKEIGRKTDSANQSYPLTVTLDIPQGLIVEPGMAATLQISLTDPREPETGFSLPVSAVFADTDQTPCVWRVDPDTLRVVKTPVTTGKLDRKTIRITSGLNPADRVVIAGTRFLRDNQEIRILGETKGILN